MQIFKSNKYNMAKKSHTMKRWLLTALFIVSSFFLMSQSPDETLENLAAKIAEKRSAVESLSSELTELKNHYNEELRSFTTQKADIEIQIKRNELRITQIERELESYREKLLSSESTLKNIKPVTARVLLQLRDYITASLPFQVPQRLSEIETLLRLLDDGNIDSGNILARVWNLVESEFRLTTESGLYRQVIEINGESMLAEVARLGMVLLFYKTFDARYGYAINTNNQWIFTNAQSTDEEHQLDFLFNSLRKNLREGYFVLPNPYAYSNK